MNRIIINKICYAIYSTLMWFVNLLKGISTNGLSYYNGITLFSKHKHSIISIGKRCVFNSSSTSNLIGINHKCIISTLQEGSSIVIGNNCGFSGTTIGCAKSIILGNNVRCGANTLITDTDWHMDDPRSGVCRPIIIEDNVWLGINSSVLKGVTIGKNSVIGAGSVVTKSIPANVIAAGNPCKVIKEINKDIIRELENKNEH